MIYDNWILYFTITWCLFPCECMNNYIFTFSQYFYTSLFLKLNHEKFLHKLFYYVTHTYTRLAGPHFMSASDKVINFESLRVDVIDILFFSVQKNYCIKKCINFNKRKLFRQI